MDFDLSSGEGGQDGTADKGAYYLATQAWCPEFNLRNPHKDEVEDGFRKPVLQPSTGALWCAPQQSNKN